MVNFIAGTSLRIAHSPRGAWPSPLPYQSPTNLPNNAEVMTTIPSFPVRLTMVQTKAPPHCQLGGVGLIDRRRAAPRARACAPTPERDPTPPEPSPSSRHRTLTALSTRPLSPRRCSRDRVHHPSSAISFMHRVRVLFVHASCTRCSDDR